MVRAGILRGGCGATWPGQHSGAPFGGCRIEGYQASWLRPLGKPALEPVSLVLAFPKCWMYRHELFPTRSLLCQDRWACWGGFPGQLLSCDTLLLLCLQGAQDNARGVGGRVLL